MSDENRVKFNIVAEIQKVDDEKRLVYGWASVVEMNGQPVIDLQNDVIRIPTLEKAAMRFIEMYRSAKEMHQGDLIGTVVQSMVFTKDVQQSLGVNLDKVGWFIAMRVDDEECWMKVKSGELKAFSIGGWANRVEIQSGV